MVGPRLLQGRGIPEGGHMVLGAMVDRPHEPPLLPPPPLWNRHSLPSEALLRAKLALCNIYRPSKSTLKFSEGF